jgi:DNA-binding MarR family transcriptional regulator
VKQPREVPPGWIAISDLARERQVDKSAISRRVARLEQLGLISTKRMGKTKLVNLAEFNHAIAATVDAVRESNGRGGVAPEAGTAAPADPVLAQQQARRAGYDAELKRLDLEERLGRIVERADVEAAVEGCVVEFVRMVDALHTRADVLAAAVTKEGVSGLRIVLRGVSRELREALARAAERFGDGDAFGEADAVEEPSEEVVA